MTRTRDEATGKEYVHFSPGTWIALIGLVAAIAGSVIGTSTRYEKRITTLETVSAYHTERLDLGVKRDDENRKEIIEKLDKIEEHLRK